MSKRSPDLGVLRKQLQPIEVDARKLTWAKRSPWKVETHVWLEQGVPTVDLHDLDVKLARRLAQELDPLGIQAGAVTFITGRGRHSPGGRSPLRQAVFSVLRKRARREGWRLVPIGSGRLALVLDPSRAPAHLQGSLGPLFWLGTLLFLAAAAWVCAGMPGA